MNLVPTNSLAKPSLWQRALDEQLKGIVLAERALGSNHVTPELLGAFRIDARMMKSAACYAWSSEIVQAVRRVAPSIPMSTELNAWNLDTSAAWWFFEDDVPIVTTDAGNPIAALNMGWFEETQDAARSVHFMVVAWVREPDGQLCPTQMFSWQPGDTLTQMEEHIRYSHRRLYGPGGRHRSVPHVKEEVFAKAAVDMGQLIMAGLTWMNQRIAVQTEESVQRQRRKEFERVTGRECTVRLVELRRRELHEDVESSEHADVKWSCRWTVDGHWRNQPCGPKHAERRLIYVNPFIKGPADAPLKPSRARVYVVRR